MIRFDVMKHPVDCHLADLARHDALGVVTLTTDEGQSYDLRQLRQGMLAEIDMIQMWLSTLGHNYSAAAVDTRHVLEVAGDLNGMFDSLASVWQQVGKHMRGKVPRKLVDQAVAHYEQGNPAGRERGDDPAAGT
ncbi:hypothetical protein [Actinophytocola sp.]|uniref:hypothetical protein n=1 Tax=Actinophytocola sp. TaxID=1872138 RepID=UPI002D29BC1E|nr:hypothetical protein [Actinophytocola sp.]HYQ69062.1 hypothetical protein [Actinophytocola sp.]